MEDRCKVVVIWFDAASIARMPTFVSMLHDSVSEAGYSPTEMMRVNPFSRILYDSRKMNLGKDSI